MAPTNLHPSLGGRLRRLSKRLLFPILRAVQRVDVPGHNSVLLTFDDGPDPDTTPAVLARLRAHDARAVFFVIGNRVRRFPSLVRRIIEEGHAVGNHTDTHRRTGRFDIVSYYHEVLDCQAAITDATGREPGLFRPPWGKLTPASILAARFLGLTTIHWSADARDWKLRQPGEAEACGLRFGQSLQPGEVLLMHDDNPQVLPLLDALLPALTERGLDLRQSLTALGGQRPPSRLRLSGLLPRRLRPQPASAD